MVATIRGSFPSRGITTQASSSACVTRNFKLKCATVSLRLSAGCQVVLLLVIVVRSQGAFLELQVEVIQ